MKSTNREGAMDGKLYEEAGARGVLGRRECRSAEKRENMAKLPVENATAG